MDIPIPFFPEPAVSNEFETARLGFASMLAQSTSSLAKTARKNINEWIEVWPIKGDLELRAMLTSKRDAQVESAVWELYINWILFRLGFKTQKLSHRENQPTPDFLATKESKSFYVEATVRTTVEDLVWRDLIQSLKKYQRADFTLFLSLEARGSQIPSARKLYRQISQELDSLISDRREPSSYDKDEFWLCEDGWVIKAIALPLKGTRPTALVAAHASGGLSPINDDLALKDKIEEKRKKYKDLELPLAIAILENSFAVSDSFEHRFDALFGSSTLNVFNDGRAELSRLDNGLWTRKVREKDCAALLLSHTSPVFSSNTEYPELWVNPMLETKDIELFSLPVIYGLSNGYYGRLT